MKFERKKLIYASLVFGWISIFWNAYDQLIQSINAYSFAMSPDESGYILAIDNILGLIFLPLFGRLSDKCKSPHGKRTPFIIVGTMISLIGLLFVGIFATSRNLIGYIIALCVTLIAMASYRSAGLSLVPDIVYEPDRSRANTLANLVSVIFTLISVVLCLTLMPLKFARASKFLPICAGVIISSLITYIVFIIKFDEPYELDLYNKKLADYKIYHPYEYKKNIENKVFKTKKEKKLNTFNKICVLSSLFFFYLAFNALVSNFTIYSDVILHFKTPQLPLITVVIGAIPGCILAITASNKFGRKKTIIFGYVMMLIAFILANFLTATSIGARIGLIICLIIAGMGFGLAMVNMYPFYLELANRDNVGENTGIYASVMTAAMVVTPILAGKIIKFAGEINGSVYYITQIVNNTEVLIEKVGDYTILLPYASTALLLAIISTLFIKSK